MTIHVSTRGVPLTPDLREHTERRLAFALGRFGERISRVRVRIVDVNGPRGGVDTCCTVQVQLPRLSPVIVEETSHEVLVAVDVAAERAGRAVSRRIDRAISRRRRARAA
jgi:ribosome-associated translation inhibitor RaiA